MLINNVQDNDNKLGNQGTMGPLIYISLYICIDIYVQGNYIRFFSLSYFFPHFTHFVAFSVLKCVIKQYSVSLIKHSITKNNVNCKTLT